MKLIEIVKAHLVAQGFDGLVQADADCGCLLDDLVPCGEDCSSCEPAYRGMDLDGNPGDWAMYRTKAAALDSVAEARNKWPNAGLSGGEPKAKPSRLNPQLGTEVD